MLQRTVQLGIVLVSHEETAEWFWEFCAEPASAVLHEPSDERGWDSGEFMFGEAPVTVGEWWRSDCERLIRCWKRLSDSPPDDLDTECAEGADGIDERNDTIEACGVVSEIWMEEIAVLGLVLSSVRESSSYRTTL